MECVVYAHTQDKNNITAYIVVNVNNVHYPVQYKILEGENFGKWTLFLTRLRLLFYFLFRTRLICFRTTYRLQMALGV